MRKILSAVLLFLLLFFAAGCEDASLPLEYGFNISGGLQLSYKCGYVLPRTTFKKDDVYLDVYYGAIDGFFLESDTVLRLYFCGTEGCDPDYGNAFLIKELNSEEASSDKYIWKGKEGYHERMTVPEEIFDRPEGEFSFTMVNYDGTFGIEQSFTVDFKMENDTVVLAVPTR